MTYAHRRKIVLGLECLFCVIVTVPFVDLRKLCPLFRKKCTHECPYEAFSDPLKPVLNLRLKRSLEKPLCIQAGDDLETLHFIGEQEEFPRP